MSLCQIELMNAGKPYPRTCQTCGLGGACVKGLVRGAPDRNPTSLPEFDAHGWCHDMSKAPRDGTVFLSIYADHPEWGCRPTIRHVRWIADYHTGRYTLTDLGAWLRVCDNDPSFQGQEGPPFVPFALAADEYNANVNYAWRPLPAPPVKEQDQ